MAERELEARLQALATPLRGPEDLDPLVDAVGDARFVLLGEASHGTHEFYAWRAQLTRRLFEEHGFTVVCVEGDWPDCRRVDRWIADPRGSAREVLHAFARWPTWMWANHEVVELVEWMGRHRAATGRELGFYGLDVYSLWDSMDRVLQHLREHRPQALPTAIRAFECFDTAGGDLDRYAARAQWLGQSCEAEVATLLAEVLRRNGEGSPEDRFDAEQNALVVRDAERYYRTMMHGGPDSWNLRDHHMVATLEHVAEHHGPDARVVVWEHNTHVGDARFTDMAGDGLVNVGQLARERWGEEAVFAVGFGTVEGSVIAAPRWDAPMRRMRVPRARPGSWEDAMHAALGADALLVLRGEEDPELHRWRGHRAIGVVYHPDREAGNYVPTVLARRYDAYVHLERTSALRPLHEVRPEEEHEPPETWPSGL